MVCYQTCVSVIAIVTYKCTLFLLLKYGITFCAVSFGFWSYCLIVYINLHCINTAKNNNTIFIVIAIVTGECTMLYYENTVLSFVWFCLILIQLVIKFISIYPESSHRNEQQYHLIALTYYHQATAKLRGYIRGQKKFVREIVTQM